MTEQELRALVRQAIAFHVGRQPASSAPPEPVVRRLEHMSHAQFVIPADSGGACVIEPTVACNHCGFCKSYGH